MERELAAMQWKIRWEELSDENYRNRDKKKKRTRKATEIVYSQSAEQAEALLRNNSRNSLNSDKVNYFVIKFLIFL